MEVTKIRARQQGLCEGEIVVEEMSTPRCQEMGQFLLATIYIYIVHLFFVFATLSLTLYCLSLDIELCP